MIVANGNARDVKIHLKGDFLLEVNTIQRIVRLPHPKCIPNHESFTANLSDLPLIATLAVLPTFFFIQLPSKRLLAVKMQVDDVLNIKINVDSRGYECDKLEAVTM